MRLAGLPSVDRTKPLVFLGLALLSAIVFGLLAASPPVTAEQAARAKLEQKREHLLDELVSLEQGKTSGKIDEKKYESKRKDLVSSLESVYKSLDQAA